MTAAEQLMERGRQRGLEQGIERGIERGRRDALLELLRVRFGALTEPVEARVHAADAAQLTRWLVRVVTAPTLEDVLAEP